MLEDDGEGLNEPIIDDFVEVEVPLSFTLKGREIPFVANLAVRFPPDDIPADKEHLTDIVTSVLMGQLDSRSTHTIVIEDMAHNKSLIERDEIQAFRILIPEHYDPADFKDD